MVESDGSRCMNISLMKCANMMNLLFHLITINVCEMLAWASDDIETTKPQQCLSRIIMAIQDVQMNRMVYRYSKVGVYLDKLISVALKRLKDCKDVILNIIHVLLTIDNIDIKCNYSLVDMNMFYFS